MKGKGSVLKSIATLIFTLGTLGRIKDADRALSFGSACPQYPALKALK